MYFSCLWCEAVSIVLALETFVALWEFRCVKGRLLSGIAAMYDGSCVALMGSWKIHDDQQNAKCSFKTLAVISMLVKQYVVVGGRHGFFSVFQRTCQNGDVIIDLASRRFMPRFKLWAVFKVVHFFHWRHIRSIWRTQIATSSVFIKGPAIRLLIMSVIILMRDFGLR